MGQQAKIRAERSKREWQPVTNELVAACADPGCKACNGGGIVERAPQVIEVCGCAPERFRQIYRERWRMRADGRVYLRPRK